MAETAVQKQEHQEVERVERVERTREGRTVLPAIDIIENDNEIVVRADMPGVSEKDIDVTLENKILTIQGFVRPEEEKKGMVSVYSENEMGDYYRSFTLSDEIDRDKIQAKYKNGVLTLILPKAESARSRKIAVKAE